MHSQRWLIIPVEVQVRELLARLLVAAIAADRGYRVLIGQDRVIRRLARYLPKGILFDKSLDGKGDRKVRRYNKLGYTIAAIDEESRGVYSDPEFFFSRRLSDEALSRSVRWFCISDLVRVEAIKYFPKYSDHFETTGLPRVDLCRPDFRAIYEKECEEIQKKYGRFILFCSNFGTILHVRRGKFLDNQMRKAAQQAPGNAAYRERIEAEGRVNLEAFIEMLPKLRDWFPDHKLLVRPHPTESHETWQEIV
ncbi:MAG: surface carbohydrate biosynthesis protein, partial [Rhizobiaceae bacterium]